MEGTIIFYSSLSLVLLFFALLKLKEFNKKLPPSPFSLPIIGHLHLLKPPLHLTLYKLSQKYGRIFSLRFGPQLVVVVSSAAAAKECFTKNDAVFANRPMLIIGKHLGYNYTTLVNAPYGDHWRNLRRISALDIFSSSRLNTFLSIRRDEVMQLLKKLSCNTMHGFAKAEIRPLLHELTFNNIVRMISGKRYYGDDVTDEEEARQFRELMAEIFENGGPSNAVDFVPLLKWIDGGKFEKKIMSISKRADAFMQGLIDEQRGRKESKNTMIDHLLSLQETQPEYYNDQIIKGLAMELLLAGTDTAAVTLEWAISNLLNNPNVLKKAQDELDAQIGQERWMDEQDIPKLQYLQNIISETLRLHPAAPLLIPHKSSSACKLEGYDIPANTILLVNAWAIHRDPEQWEEGTTFKPERFEIESTEADEGKSHKLMPFGMGRRSCPGMSLAHRMLGLALGSLIQCFEWERDGEKEIEMSEGSGLTVPKAEPLVAMCKSRPVIEKVLYQKCT